jgi:hypothetical protein
MNSIPSRSAGHRKEGDTVSGVGCRNRDVGCVVCAGGKLRSEGESENCVDGMLIWKSDGGPGKRVMEFGFQTLNSVLGLMLESN